MTPEVVLAGSVVKARTRLVSYSNEEETVDVEIFAEIPAYAQRLQILTRAPPCLVVFQAKDNELLRSEEGKASCDERGMVAVWRLGNA